MTKTLVGMCQNTAHTLFFPLTDSLVLDPPLSLGSIFGLFANCSPTTWVMRQNMGQFRPFLGPVRSFRFSDLFVWFSGW